MSNWFRTLVSPTLGGKGKWQAFTDVNITPAKLIGLGGSFPGQTIAVWGGLYQMIQNRSGGALAIGDVVSLALPVAARTGNLVAASTVYQVVTDDTLDSGLAGSEAYPGHVGFTATALATTAAETHRYILGNTTDAGASKITVAVPDLSDGLVNGAAVNSPEIVGTVTSATDPSISGAANYDYEVFCPWEVVKTDLDALETSVPQGVVCSTTIADDNFGVIQIAGVCMANVDGTTDLAQGDLLIPDAAAGVLSKWVITDNNATTIAAEILRANFVFGRICGAYTANSVGLRMCIMQNRPLFPWPVAA